MSTPSPEDVESRIIMQGIHVALTPTMQTAIREKFAVLFRHQERIIRVNIRLHQDQTMGNEHHYTATGQIEIGGPDIVASVDGKDAYDALDSLSAKLDKQLRRRAGLRKDHRNHPHAVEIEADLPKVE